MPTKEQTTNLSETTTETFGDAKSFYLFRILQSLRQSIRAIDQYSRQLSAKYHVTAPQLICLHAIQDEGKPINPVSLARKVHLSPSTVAGILERLEKKQLVEKRKDETDKRKVLVYITKAGEQLIDEAPKPLQDKLADSFHALSEDEQLAIVNSLEKVVDMIQARNIDASPVLETGPLTCPPELKNTFWQAIEEDHAPSVTITSTPGEPLTIRPAEPKDKNNIIRFINSSVEWYRSIIDEQDLHQHAVSDSWAEENMKEREFFVAAASGTPVGTLSMQFFGDYAYLGYIYIDTAHVGKGYGHQLLCYAKEEATRRGMKGMVLIAHPQATWAIKAYQKFGFELIYRDREDILNWNNGALKPYYEEYFMMFLYNLEQ